MVELIFRSIFVAVLVLSLSISAYFRRRARSHGDTISRQEESAALKAGRLLIGLPLYASLVAYAISPRLMAWSEVPLPTWLRWVGAGMGIAVLPTIYWVLSSLGSNVSETILTKRYHKLVTHGPYRWVRHPLYTVGVGLIASLSLLAANWFMALMVVVVVALLPALAHKEENHLIEKFGDEYIRYKNSTGRFLPLLRRPRR